MKKLFMIAGLSVALLSGCNESVKSEGNVEITVLTSGSTGTVYGEVYKDEEIKDYYLGDTNSRIKIYLKNGDEIITTNFVLKKKGGKQK